MPRNGQLVSHKDGKSHAEKKGGPTRTQTTALQAHKIFISHATADKWVARMICERLEAAGLDTFIDDRDIAGGDDIPLMIQAEIRRCAELVVLLTPQSVGRAWVMLEVGMALIRRCRINVLLYHVTVDGIPEMLKAKKAYNLNDAERYIADVKERATNRGPRQR